MTGTKVKRNPRKWERIFATCVSVKGLVYRMYKERLQINEEKIQITQEKNGQRPSTDTLQKKMSE